MNKITCKLTSLLLTLTFLMSMVCVSVSAEGITLSATGTTRINGSDYTTSTVSTTTKSGTNLILKNTAAGNTVTYTVNAPAAGYYRAAIAAGIDKTAGSGSVDWSILNAPTLLSDTSKSSDYTIDGWSYKCRHYDLGSIYLNQGINTITWKVESNFGGNECAIVYIDLTKHPEPEIALSGTTTIMGEEYTTEYAQTNVASDGAKRWGINRLNNPYDGERVLSVLSSKSAVGDKATYRVTAPVTGYYGIKVTASEMGPDALANWKVYANESTNTVTKYESIDTMASNFANTFQNQMKIYDCGQIYLTQGQNDITWEVETAGRKVALYSIELTPPAIHTLSAAGTTRINGSGYAQSTVSKTIVNGTNLILQNTAAGNTVTYTVNAPSAGYYRAAIAAGIDKVANSGSVDWSVLNTPTLLSDTSGSADYTIDGWSYKCRNYDLGSIYLNQGINTITWKVESNFGGTECAIVYIELTKHPEPEIALSGTTTIMGEEYTTEYVQTNTANDGKRWGINRLNNPYDGVRVLSVLGSNSAVGDKTTYRVTAPVTGNYGIKVTASERGGSGLASWKVYANESTNTVTKYESIGTMASNFANTFQNQMKIYDCGEIYLTQGQNDITWEVETAGKKVALYSIELTPIGIVPPTPTPEPTPEPSPIPVSATEKTKIEGENYTASTYSNPTVKELSTGRTGVYVEDTQTTSTYTTSYKVNVTKAGFYKIEAAASLMNGDNLSNWTIYANSTDNSATSYTKGDTFRINGIGPDGGALFDCGRIYLNAGENTIYWSFGKAPNANQVKAALDYIELTPPTPILVSATGTTQIKGGDYTATTYTGTMTTYTSKLTGGLGAAVPNHNVANGTKYTLSYEVNVEEAGYYKLTVAGNNRHGDDNLSVWRIPLSKADQYIGYTEGTKGPFVITPINSTGLNGYIYEGGPIYLEKGVQTIDWEIGEKRKDSLNQIWGAIDYIELTKHTVKTIAHDAPTRIEGEEFAAVSGTYTFNRVNDPFDGAVGLHYNKATPVSGVQYYATYEVDVEWAGTYNLKTLSSIKGKDYTSDWIIYTNGKQSNEVTAYTMGEAVATKNLLNGHMYVYDCGNIELNQGKNTITWKVNENDKQSDSKLVAGMDYIDLTPVAVVEPTPAPTPEPTPPPYAEREAVTPDSEGTVQAEVGFGGTTAIGASNNTVLSVIGGTKVNEIPVNVSAEGDYMIEVCGTGGNVTITIDGGTANERVAVLGTAATLKTEEGAYFTNGNYAYDTYVLATAVHLTADNKHSVKITLDGSTTAAGADYIKFTKMEEPDFTVSPAKWDPSVGDSTNITLSGINVSDMYMVTYETEDDSVVMVDGNGRVIATGAGTADIYVTVKKYVISNGVTKSLEVTATTPDALYIKNEKFEDGFFKADLMRGNGDMPSGVKAYITVYDQGILKYIEVKDVQEFTGKMELQSSDDLQASAGDIIELFVWDSSLTPVCDPVSVRVK